MALVFSVKFRVANRMADIVRIRMILVLRLWECAIKVFLCVGGFLFCEFWIFMLLLFGWLKRKRGGFLCLCVVGEEAECE